MVGSGWPKPKAVAAAVLGSCVIAASLFVRDEPHVPSSPAVEVSPVSEWTDSDPLRLLQESELEGVDGRGTGQQPGQQQGRKHIQQHGQLPGQQRVQQPDGPRQGPQQLIYEDDPSMVYPWAQRLVIPVTAVPDPSKEKILFWNIPKSGGTTAKDLYRCMGRNIDIESQPEQILRAEKIGLVRSGQVDIVFSSSPDFAIEHLFDTSHQARVLAMFRHPVDRLISKFYYLQEAISEKTYRPEWRDMDILEWIENHNSDNDHMVKKLAGKGLGEEATKTDLMSAKKTIRQRFIVGLVPEMKESFQRFNTVMGINDDTNKNHNRCMVQFFGKGDKNRNQAVAHPKSVEGSAAWIFLAEKNALDIQLYNFAVELFEEQKKFIRSYSNAAAASPA